jgi:hypothetical protein
MLEPLVHGLRWLAIAGGSWLLIGGFLAGALRAYRLRWTWAFAGAPLSAVALPLNEEAALFGLAVTGLAVALGAGWHHHDLVDGADHAERSRALRGIGDAVVTWRHSRHARGGRCINEQGMVIGVDRSGSPVRIPFGEHTGCHTLVVGATGSGKTVTQAWIAARAIEHGHGAIIIDPKGDRFLREQLQAAAERRGARMLEWSPEGPCTYNPYAHGGDSEIAEKALAGELFTEPHYLRQAQRYLGHAVRAMRAAQVEITPRLLMEHLNPAQVEVTARGLDAETAEPVQRYLDSLGERQRRDLAGVRDRLSILAESDLARWLERNGGPAIDLPRVADSGSVAYFALESDRWPLLAQMLGAAIVGDLLTITATLQRGPRPTLVLIDEFPAVASAQVARLFARARSAGISLLLGTPELADLRGDASDQLRDQVLGNVSTLIAHRQNVPESAELVSGLAGTRAVWVHTQRVDYGLLGASRADAGTRTRGYEYIIHPGTLKGLPIGNAAVATPGGQSAKVVRIHDPNEATR